jgi:hypothetical protein
LRHFVCKVVSLVHYLLKQTNVDSSFPTEVNPMYQYDLLFSP